MQVVDPHIHLWDLQTHRYPWLENPGVSFVGDARALKHDYLLEHLLADAGEIEVLKIVHVEANPEPLLHGDDDADVGEAVPARHVARRCRRREMDIIGVQDFA